MKINISDVQHFSVGDGQGIRTTVFFKGCNLCCPWCHNPENLSFSPVVLRYKAIGKTEMKGKKVSIDDILPELLEDKDFYIESGGGITLSGGEVMLQPEGAAALAKKLKEYGISTIIDTAGSVSYDAFEKVNPFVQGYLFDFKTADENKYSKIGGDLKTVTENLMKLIKSSAKVQVRIPLIPDFNTDEASVIKICETLAGIGINEVELLPFHRLGGAKYEALGMDYLYRDCQPIPKEKLDEINNLYSKYFKTKIER
jgi:pyruvate formate lyase activating enzyme